jgi:hypothetical protein
MLDNLLTFDERQTEQFKIIITQNSWNLCWESKGVLAEGKCWSSGPHKRDIRHHQSEKLLRLLSRNSESGLFAFQNDPIFYFSQNKLIYLTTRTWVFVYKMIFAHLNKVLTSFHEIEYLLWCLQQFDVGLRRETIYSVGFHQALCQQLPLGR